MGVLRVNGERYELPPDLCGDQYFNTARMRGSQYVNVFIQGGKFEFDHPAMQRLLNRLESPEGGDFADIVREELASLRCAYKAAL